MKFPSFSLWFGSLIASQVLNIVPNTRESEREEEASESVKAADEQALQVEISTHGEVGFWHQSERKAVHLIEELDSHHHFLPFLSSFCIKERILQSYP